jgi:UDP-N-acetyl-D-galactosamine dehydrogenase
VVVAVAHRAFREGGWPLVQRLMASDGGVVVDVRGILPRESCPDNMTLWRL